MFYVSIFFWISKQPKAGKTPARTVLRPASARAYYNVVKMEAGGGSYRAFDGEDAPSRGTFTNVEISRLPQAQRQRRDYQATSMSHRQPPSVAGGRGRTFLVKKTK